MERQTKPQNLFIRRKMWLTALAAFVLLVFGATLAIVTPIGVAKYPPEDSATAVLLCVGASIIALYTLILSALNIRNLFFPYVLTADEKGIYNYSGLFHYGFIGWENIEAISKDVTWLDVIDEGAPSIKVYVKNLKEYKKTIGFAKKWLLFWSGSDVKVLTVCSQIKKNRLCGLLEEALNYYGRPEEPAPEDEGAAGDGGIM